MTRSSVARRPVVVGERAQAAVAHHEVLVGEERAPLRELGEEHRVGLLVEPRDHLAREPFPARGARVEAVHVPDLARRVVLGHEAEGLGLDAEVDVLADEDDLPVLPPLAQLVGQGQDAVVGLAEREGLADPGGCRLPHLDVEPSPPLPERQTLGERPVARELVELADELPRLEVDEVVTALEAVELLQHDDRQGDVVLLEVVDAGVIEEDDVRVDHEELLHLPSRRLARRGRATPAGRPKSGRSRASGGRSGGSCGLTGRKRVIRSRQS